MQTLQNERIKALCASESELICQFSKAQSDFLHFFESDVKSLPAHSIKPFEKMPAMHPDYRQNPKETEFGDIIEKTYPRFGAFIDKLEIFIDHQELLPSKIIRMIDNLALLMRMKEEAGKASPSKEGALARAEADVNELWEDLRYFQSHFREIRKEFSQIKSHLNAGAN